MFFHKHNTGGLSHCTQMQHEASPGFSQWGGNGSGCPSSPRSPKLVMCFENRRLCLLRIVPGFIFLKFTVARWWKAATVKTCQLWLLGFFFCLFFPLLCYPRLSSHWLSSVGRILFWLPPPSVCGSTQCNYRAVCLCKESLLWNSTFQQRCYFRFFNAQAVFNMLNCACVCL